MEKNPNSTSPRLLLFLLLATPLLLSSLTGAHAATETDKCGEEFQKVTACLSYATGKASVPSKECCTSVGDLKDSDPMCLCYIMQQTNNGSSSFKSLGIQEDKLLQLPASCMLKNASLSLCPKLLGLSPSSPDAAIFNSTSTTPATSSTGTPAGTVVTPTGVSSRHGPSHFSFFTMFIATIAYVFTPGYASL